MANGQTESAGPRPPFTRFVVAGMVTVAASALGATVLVTTPPSVSMDVAMMAAIDESNTTIGIADSDLYFASPAQVDAALDQMQAMGVNTVRIGIPWAGINPVPGYYNWSQADYMINAADARGMGVLAVITTTPGWANDPSAPGIYGHPASPADFGTFAGLAAQRYAGKVGAYEIWNEPNAALYYGPQPDPAGYTALLKAAYPAIKAADPNATVVGGVVGSTVTYKNQTLNPVTFVDEMYQNGAQGYFDALSFHPYQYTTPFSQGAYNPNNPIVQLADIHDLMVANGDAGKTIWASEYGEPSSVGGDTQQAAYLQDMLTTWRTIDYTGPAFVYTLQDTAAAGTASATPEDSLGLIRTDGTWKPAAYVVRSLTTLPATAPTDTPAVTARLASVAQAPTAAVAMQAPVLQTPVLQTPTLQTSPVAVTQQAATSSGTTATQSSVTTSSGTTATQPSGTTATQPSGATTKRPTDGSSKPRAERHR
ncbi:MAG: polysaccharide biosynthesis protein PslG [Mycobacterium sp.]|nr:polysaccharide biosynthesis protein PslG [Mycobacterium sp.]